MSLCEKSASHRKSWQVERNNVKCLFTLHGVIVVNAAFHFQRVRTFVSLRWRIIVLRCHGNASICRCSNAISWCCRNQNQQDKPSKMYVRRHSAQVWHVGSRKRTAYTRSMPVKWAATEKDYVGVWWRSQWRGVHSCVRLEAPGRTRTVGSAWHSLAMRFNACVRVGTGNFLYKACWVWAVRYTSDTGEIYIWHRSPTHESSVTIARRSLWTQNVCLTCSATEQMS